MRGCILHGRYRFLQDELVGERKPVKAVPAAAAKPGKAR